MYKRVLRKLLEGFLTLLAATLILFTLIRFAPGDPVDLLLGQPGEVAASHSQAYDERAAELRTRWGLDQSMPTQYASWAWRLLHLDLGTSIHTGRAVSSELADRIPATAILTAAALLLQTGLGVLLGIGSALKAGRSYDHVIRLLCIIMASVPAFVIGLLLLSLFAVKAGVYEISSEASLSRLWLPALTLGLIGAPPFIRLVRANMLAELGQLYVLSALARGLDRKRVVRHALRNALLPAVTVMALSLTSLISGAVVIESIFSWPGLGKYALDSLLLKDYPVIQGYALVMIALVIIIHLFVDIMYARVDPRVRRPEEAGVEEYA
ncbi:ABC transporter permease [Paenibacillus filicis]|uniref:ABC transporter permease n=1 Tax=Paenibacillus filicis TaxID=669464 RepID=A0ABU9DRQ4_9BACL